MDLQGGEDFPTWLKDILGITNVENHKGHVHYTPDDAVLEPLESSSAEVMASLGEPTPLDIRVNGYRRRLGLILHYEKSVVFSQMCDIAEQMKEAGAEREYVQALMECFYSILDDAIKARSVLVASTMRLKWDEGFSDDIAFALANTSFDYVDDTGMADLNTAMNIVRHEAWALIGGEMDQTREVLERVFEEQ